MIYILFRVVLSFALRFIEVSIELALINCLLSRSKNKNKNKNLSLEFPLTDKYLSNTPVV